MVVHMEMEVGFAVVKLTVFDKQKINVIQNMGFCRKKVNSREHVVLQSCTSLSKASASGRACLRLA